MSSIRAGSPLSTKTQAGDPTPLSRSNMKALGPPGPLAAERKAGTRVAVPLRDSDCMKDKYDTLTCRRLPAPQLLEGSITRDAMS